MNTNIRIKELIVDNVIHPKTENKEKESQGGTKMVVIGKPGCFLAGTKVLLYNGSIKNVENITTNDVLYGDDGTPRKVLDLCRNIDDMYIIKPKFGQNVIVNKTHILSLIKINGRNSGLKVDIVLEDYLKLPYKHREQYHWYRTMCEFPSQEVEIDPYVYGFLSNGGMKITKINYILNNYSINDNLFNHIPDRIMNSKYIVNSIKNRVNLLSGILDSHGIYNTNTKRFIITSDNEEYIDQVIYISGSLGYYCSKLKNLTSNFILNQKKTLYQCYIYPNTNCILNTRILKPEYNTVSFNGLFTTEFNIEYFNKKQYYGFIVNDNHRFLLSDFSVVHNTGKCLGKDTPITMYDGSLKMVQDIVVGDELLGDDLSKRRVLSTTTGKEKLYKIIQDYGQDYVVNESHILCLKLNDTVVNVPLIEFIKDPDKYKTVRIVPRGIDYDFDFLNYGYKTNVNTILDEQLMQTCSVKNRSDFVKGLIYNCKSIHKNFKSFDTIVRILYSLNLNYIVHNGHVILYNSRLDGLSYKPIGQGDYYGFEIDGNKRFVLGDYTITHNTTLISSLFYEKRHIFPAGIVCSGTEDSNSFWQSIFPSSFVFNKFDTNQIENYIKRQKIAKKFLPNPWSVLLLDDCTDDTSILNKQLFQNIFKNGRHWKMWFILSLQYAGDIKPVIRTNVDVVFILREPNRRNREILWKNYASIIPEFNLFCKIMDVITEDYTALVINNASTSNNWFDNVFYYRATKPPDDFKFGSVEFWKYHYSRFNKEYNEFL
jgi:hypothetical protein